jgi:predicted nicotinamide N-methyase
MTTLTSLLVTSCFTPPPGVSTRSVDLGAGRSMSVLVPDEDVASENEAIASILGIDLDLVTAQRTALESFDNAVGQKLWPASQAFARMLTETPSQVKDLDVVELGCGLGAVGIAAALAGARSVLLTDFQERSLELAALTAEANGVADRVSTRLLDWTDVPEDLGSADVIVGADVLYDSALAGHLLDVVARYICVPRKDRTRAEPRCLLVDPPMRQARAKLPELCAARGLYWGGELPVVQAEAEADTVMITLLRG